MAEPPFGTAPVYCITYAAVNKHLVLGAQVLEDFLLMPVDPVGEDQEQQLPRLQDRLHISPDIVNKVEASGISGCLSTAGRSVGAVRRKSRKFRDLQLG